MLYAHLLTTTWGGVYRCLEDLEGVLYMYLEGLEGFEIDVRERRGKAGCELCVRERRVRMGF